MAAVQEINGCRAQEPNGWGPGIQWLPWGPGHQWFGSRKPMVGAEDINVGHQEPNGWGPGDQ